MRIVERHVNVRASLLFLRVPSRQLYAPRLSICRCDRPRAAHMLTSSTSSLHNSYTTHGHGCCTSMGSPLHNPPPVVTPRTGPHTITRVRLRPSLSLSLSLSINSHSMGCEVCCLLNGPHEHGGILSLALSSIHQPRPFVSSSSTLLFFFSLCNTPALLPRCTHVEQLSVSSLTLTTSIAAPVRRAASSILLFVHKRSNVHFLAPPSRLLLSELHNTSPAAVASSEAARRRA